MRFLGDLELQTGRVHEACGPARHTLALILAQLTAGPVLWIRPLKARYTLNGVAIAEWIDPGRLVFLMGKRPEDMFWAMEEALRDGHVPLVVADLSETPELTPVRRLHLAAEAGAGAMGESPPLGLLLTPGQEGTPGIETRWYFSSAHGPETKQANTSAPRGATWRLERLRARTLPPAAWEVSLRAPATRQRHLSIAPPRPAAIG
ncbi:hypothetical protein RXV90_01960 [Rhodophyticola sp. MJ-SS7]|nr:hypothetical protein [Rhodophyticola sp. MJ-SS7]